MDNEYDDIIEFTTTSKNFLIPGRWVDLDDKDLSRLYEEVYDRWNFETGSDEDLQTMKDLEKEIKYRKYIDDCVDALCKEDYEHIMKGLTIGDTNE